MKKSLPSPWLFLIAFCRVACAFIRVKDGHEHVVVALPPTLTKDEGQRLLQPIKELFNSSSQVLFKATDGHFHFKSVSVLIPSTWEDVTDATQATFETFWEADIRIEERSDNLINGIATQQPRGCGKPGDFISMSKDFLLQWNSHNETAIQEFVRAWARYRFGIFDESHHQKTSRYIPLLFHGRHGFRKTGCSNPYHWTLEDENCLLAPETWGDCQFLFNSTEKVFSSIMDESQPMATLFCGVNQNSEHDSEAPTEHNSLCNGKSAWEVIQTTTNIQSNLNDWNQYGGSFSLNVVYAVPMTLALIVDSDLCTEKSKAGLTIRETLKSLSLPIGTYLTIVFTNETLPSDTADPFEKLTSTDTDDIMKTFLRKCRNNYPATEKIDDILVNLTHIVQNRTGEKEIVILAMGTNLDHNFEDHLSNLHEKSQMRFNIIFFNLKKIDIEFKINSKWSPQISWFYLGPQLPFSSEGFLDAKAGAHIHQIFHNIIERHGDSFKPKDILIYEYHYEQTPANGQFVAPSKGNISITLFFPHDQIEGVSLYLYQDDFNQEIFIEGTRRACHVENIQVKAGTIDYKIEEQTVSIWIYFKSDTEIVSVLGSAETETIRLNRESDLEAQVLLRASVRLGNVPVINAKVTALITTPDNKELEIELLDSGNGDPDIYLKDGIYSRYFVEYGSKAGWYSITLIADDHNQTACLDTNINNETQGLLPPFFSTKKYIGSIYSNLTENHKKIMPPNRIHDFGILEYNTTVSIVTFTWTAPGADFDTGVATSYQLQCNSTRSSLENYDLYVPINMKPVGTFGSRETYSWTVATANITYYCAILAEDNDGNKNVHSNVLTVYLPVPFADSHTTPDTEEETLDFNNTDPSHFSTWTSSQFDYNTDSTNASNTTEAIGDPPVMLSQMEIIAIGVCGAMIFVIMVVVLIACLARRRSRKNSAAPPATSHHRSNSAYQVDVVRSQHRPESFAQMNDYADADFLESLENIRFAENIAFHAGQTPAVDDEDDENDEEEKLSSISSSSMGSRSDYGTDSGNRRTFPSTYFTASQRPLEMPLSNLNDELIYAVPNNQAHPLSSFRAKRSVPIPPPKIPTNDRKAETTRPNRSPPPPYQKREVHLSPKVPPVGHPRKIPFSSPPPSSAFHSRSLESMHLNPSHPSAARLVPYASNPTLRPQQNIQNQPPPPPRLPPKPVSSKAKIGTLV